MRTLITGANGFTASHLIKLLSGDPTCELLLTDQQGSDKDNFCVCDLTDSDSVSKLLSDTLPDRIYHLAGSFSNNYELDYKVNVLTAKHFLDHSLKLNLACRIFLIGSSAEYGNVPEKDNPVNEDYPLNPVSIYGLSKTYQTYMMKYYCNIHNVDVVMARPFNIFGNGISNKLFIGSIHTQIEKYKKGEISKIILGNLQNKRDYIHINEVVRNYKIIMEYGMRGEIYNVGTGKSIRIYDLLKNILAENGLSMDIVEERYQVNPNKLDVKDLFADTGKITKLTRKMGLPVQ